MFSILNITTLNISRSLLWDIALPGLEESKRENYVL